MTDELPCVLITGAAGAIGRTIRPALSSLSRLVRAGDIADLQAMSDNEECISLDLRSFQSVRAAADNIDTIFHFGGLPIGAGWEGIRDVYIEGTYHVFEAARQAGVRRVVYASSNHVVGFYRRDCTIGPDVLPKADSQYGVSKIFGEALGQLYANKHGIEVISLRIGQFRPKPTNQRMLSLWLSPGDMARLAVRCLLASDVNFEVVYGVSANTRSWYENPGAERIGFKPVDNAEDYVGSISAEGLSEGSVESTFQGGPFCAAEFEAGAELKPAS